MHPRKHSVSRQALDDYTSIVERHPGLAVTEYARLSRALMLFQTGRPADAVLQLDDLRVSMLGCARHGVRDSCRSDSTSPASVSCTQHAQNTASTALPLLFALEQNLDAPPCGS